MLKIYMLPVLLSALCLALASAQTQPESCKTVCSSLSGSCDVSLTQLARTPCFDDKKKVIRTCDCGLDLTRIQSLKETDTVRDCVIPRPLIGSGGTIEIKANMLNVHMVSISNRGTLRQSGDIKGSTICDWRCAGQNRFQNCIMSGNVLKSTFRTMSAEQESTLVITGDKFVKNSVDNIRSDGDIQIGNKKGFNGNKVGILATSQSGRFTSVLGTRMIKNTFEVISLNAVSSFAILDKNTADVASVNGPCSILQVKSKIATDRLTLPRPDPTRCDEMFEQI